MVDRMDVGQGHFVLGQRNNSIEQLVISGTIC